MFIFGENYYGKVDVVPKLFYVKTRFFHINAIPLIPIKSYLLFDDVGGPPRGFAIPLRFKSVFLTWARLVMGLILGLGTLLFGWLVWVILEHKVPPDGRIKAFGAEAAIILTLGLVAWLYRMTFQWSIASLDRAVELGKLAGISPKIISSRFNEAVGEFV